MRGSQSLWARGSCGPFVDRQAFLRTMRALASRYKVRDWSRGMSPFEVLVSTILSQNTTVANERRALHDLRAAVGPLTPEALAATKEDVIARAIWHAGLSRQKAPRIRAAAREILSRWDGRIERILSLPIEEVRTALQSLPGVGPKTADVVLAMTANRPVFPVDTHIARIARRWKLVRRGGYERVREALEAWSPPDRRRVWHLAMIAHGRTLCKARKPRCVECPVARDCDWYQDRLETEKAGRSSAKARQQRVKNR